MSDEEVEAAAEAGLPIPSRSQKGISREDYEARLDRAAEKIGSLADLIDNIDIPGEMRVLRPVLDCILNVAKDHSSGLRETTDVLSQEAKWQTLASNPVKFTAELQTIFKSIEHRMKSRYPFIRNRPRQNEDRNRVVYEFVRAYRKRKPRASFGEIVIAYNSKFGTKFTGKRLNKMYSDHAVVERKFLRKCLKAAFPFETFDPSVFRSITGVE